MERDKSTHNPNFDPFYYDDLKEWEDGEQSLDYDYSSLDNDSSLNYDPEYDFDEESLEERVIRLENLIQSISEAIAKFNG